MAKKQEDSWLTAGEVWEQFKFSPQSLYHLRKAGRIRSKRKGHIKDKGGSCDFLYSAASIEVYFDERDERKAKVKRP